MAVELNTVECLTALAEMEIEQVLEETFSNSFRLGGNKPELQQIADTKVLRIKLINNGLSPHDFDPILRPILEKQLTINIRHAKVWSSPDSDSQELFNAHEEQAEAFARWEIFISQLEDPIDLNALKRACRSAFERYEHPKIEFNQEQERTLYQEMLKNEHQKDHLLYGLKQASEPDPECRLENYAVYFKGVLYPLQPNLWGILHLLWDGLPHPAVEIMQKAFGTNAIFTEEKTSLSKRITKLNKTLDKIFGKPETGRWIRRVHHPKGLAYRLFKDW